MAATTLLSPVRQRALQCGHGIGAGPGWELPFDRWLNERMWVAESAVEENVQWGAAPA